MNELRGFRLYALILVLLTKLKVRPNVLVMLLMTWCPCRGVCCECWKLVAWAGLARAFFGQFLECQSPIPLTICPPFSSHSTPHARLFHELLVRRHFFIPTCHTCCIACIAESIEFARLENNMCQRLACGNAKYRKWEEWSRGVSRCCRYSSIIALHGKSLSARYESRL